MKPTSSPRAPAARCRRGRGFTLVEVMAAVMLLAVALVVMLDLRNRALARAVDARSESIAARMALRLLHRIQAARVPDLFDGYSGDFSEEGFPDFTYLIGLGEGSSFAAGAVDDSELAWRRVLEKQYEESEESESKPELTRVFLTVTYPGGDGTESEYHLETLVPTWAVYQDYELYEEKWGMLLPKEIE